MKTILHGEIGKKKDKHPSEFYLTRATCTLINDYCSTLSFFLREPGKTWLVDRGNEEYENIQRTT